MIIALQICVCRVFGSSFEQEVLLIIDVYILTSLIHFIVPPFCTVNTRLHIHVTLIIPY